MTDHHSILVITPDANTRSLLHSLVQDGLGLPFIDLPDIAGQDCSAFCAENGVALVMLDEAMARRDGYRALATLDAASAGPLVLLLSQFYDPERAVHGLDAGATDVLRLPLDRAETTARLRAVLRRCRRRAPQPAAVAA